MNREVYRRIPAGSFGAVYAVVFLGVVIVVLTVGDRIARLLNKTRTENIKLVASLCASAVLAAAGLMMKRRRLRAERVRRGQCIHCGHRLQELDAVCPGCGKSAIEQ
jgi:hypothetical protein